MERETSYLCLPLGWLGSGRGGPLIPHAAVNHMAQCPPCQDLSNSSISSSEGFSLFILFFNFISFYRLCNQYLIHSSWHSLDEEIEAQRRVVSRDHPVRQKGMVGREARSSLTPSLFSILILELKKKDTHQLQRHGFIGKKGSWELCCFFGGRRGEVQDEY